MTRTNVPLLSQSQIKRTTHRQYSPNSLFQQRSHQGTFVSINGLPLNNQLSSVSITKSNCNEKRHQFSFPHRRQGQSATNNNKNNNNNDCGSKTNRSINNCEKFLFNHETTNLAEDSDLLIIHSVQPTRFT